MEYFEVLKEKVVHVGQKALSAFWGELSPSEHFVQIYDSDSVLLDTLADFIGDGLVEGQACIFIVTPSHRAGLDKRLRAKGINISAAKADDSYICLDAEATLKKFMVNGWPDDRLFSNLITDVIERAMRKGRRVRAFGEMVALMWALGQCGATVRLEHMWNDLCDKMAFTLFCAYPKAGFTENAEDSIARICCAHSKVLKNDANAA